MNQMTDYLNRGETLKHMCIWDYCARVYKCKLSKEDLKKFEPEKHPEKETSNKTFKMHKYFHDHPQSETHGQKERIKGSFPIPTLTKLPPSSTQDRVKFQKCMLLLFKPFTTFEELYNGISWNETYLEFLEITDKKQHIDNIEELHKGIEGKDENDENDDIIEEIEDEDCEDDPNQLEDTDDTELDSETVEAIKVIESTPWLNESISDPRNESNLHSLFEGNSSNIPSIKNWQKDMKRQNQDIVDNPESENNDPAPTEHMATVGDNVDVTFSIEGASSSKIAQERDRVNRLREEI